MRASIALGGVALTAILVFTGVGDGPSPAQTRAADAVGAPRVQLEGSAADAQGGTPLTAPLTVVLMGDSYTAGNGARADGEAAYYGPEKCMRSTNTWGEQYAQLLNEDGFAVTMLNRACSAATADAVLHGKDMKDARVVVYPESEDPAAPRSDEFYATWARSSARCTPAPATEEYFTSRVLRSPTADGSVHVAVSCKRWIAPQVDALNPDVDLVLLTLGGNDAHFPDIVRSCLIIGDVPGCEDAVDTAMDYVTTDYAKDLTDVFAEIVRRTDGHARVAYLAYPGLEVNNDLRLTQIDARGLHAYPVAAQLARLADEGLRAQRAAAEAVNAAVGAGTITFVDGVPDLFAGHEPDARPSVANPDRWMYEVFETTTRDEWYHLKPEGHAHIAELMAAHGAFGARDDNGRARDVALVIDDNPGVRDAVAAALQDWRVWAGARVAIVEQRLAEGGVRLERRVVVPATDPADALAALQGDARRAWERADDVRLPSRWNAAAQAVYVGSSAASGARPLPVWEGVDNENAVEVDKRTEVFHAGSDITPGQVEARLIDALARAAEAPHAWAGGPYLEGERDLVLTASGSVGDGRLDFTWDLDGDGVYETKASGPLLQVPSGTVDSGWVAVRVAAEGGQASVAVAWVSARSHGAAHTPPCVADSGAGAGLSGSGRPMCGAPTMSLIEREVSMVPRAPAPARVRPHDASAVVGENALAAFSLVPVYAEPRVTTFRGSRSEIPTRAGDRSRQRPFELVHRERGLRALLRAGLLASPAP